MEDSNLRLLVTVYVPNPRLQEEAEAWFREKQVEMFKTNLFERVVRKISSMQNHAFTYGFVFKNHASLQIFQNQHLFKLIGDFQKRFPKTKHVEIIPVLGEMEVLD